MTLQSKKGTRYGPLFETVLRCGETSMPTNRALIVFGFIAGEAEKVSLGAFLAAMFRPDPEDKELFMEVLKQVTGIYKLYWTAHDTGGDVEYWISRWETKAMIDQLDVIGEHDGYRGMLCGIPFNEIDLTWSG